MVSRSRFRSALLQVGLWLLSAGLVSFFGYHAMHGKRGLVAQRSFETAIAELRASLSRVEAERKALEDRVALLDPKGVDRDLLDEEARESLGWLHANDRVVGWR